MRKISLVVVLVLVIAIPAFAQINVPIKVKPLMIYTANDSGEPTATFSVGQTIHCNTDYEVKGYGTVKVRLDVLNSAGVLINRVKWGSVLGDVPTWELWFLFITPSPGVPEVAGYYTLKIVYTDVATSNTWSHQTKVHVSAPL
jgi:hypothetical protein